MTTFSLIGFLVLRHAANDDFLPGLEFLVLSTQFPVLSWIERAWAGDV